MKIELLLNSAPIKQTYWKGRGEAGRELYIGGKKMDLESDLKKVSLINRNKFAGLEKAQGKSRDLSQPQQPKHFRVFRQKASSLQKIISRWDEAQTAQSSYWSVREILYSDWLIAATLSRYPLLYSLCSNHLYHLSFSLLEHLYWE